MHATSRFSALDMAPEKGCRSVLFADAIRAMGDDIEADI